MLKILLATDTDLASDGAIRVAAKLASEQGASVEALRVVEPLPVVGEGVALGALPYDVDAEAGGRGATALAELEEKLRTFGAPAATWLKRVESGPAPYTIVRVAEDVGATHILLGIGRHKLVDRWLGTETALRVMQLSHLPVLALPAKAGSRPRRLVAAVDFSRFSRRAIEHALEICQPDSRFDLVHVAWVSPGENSAFEYADWHERLQGQLHQHLADWAAEIPGLFEHRVELHVPAGRAPDEILRVAEDVGADMIVSGSHGHGFVGRSVFGSVSKALIRRAECAVLVTPPEEPAAEIRGMASASEARTRV